MDWWMIRSRVKCEVRDARSAVNQYCSGKERSHMNALDIPPSEPFIRGTSSRLDKVGKDSGPQRMSTSSSYSRPSQPTIKIRN